MNGPKNVFDEWNDDGNLPQIKSCPFCGGKGILCSNGYEEPVIDSNTGAYVDMDIFEGDIIEFDDTGEEGYEYKEGFDFRNRAVIVWNNGRFELDKPMSDNSEVLDFMNNCHEDFWDALKSCEVIANTFDNPNLLKGGDDT